MPTYEYECEACEHRFDVFQKMGSPAQQVCPACKKRRLRRLIGSGAGIIFKGSGFYETDYRSESYRKAAEADRASESPKDAKDAPQDSKGAAQDAKPKSAGTGESAAKPKKKKQKKAP
ncbi:MAG: FmdB family zinc ribbon protein [Planctomycetota bacterium]